MASPEKLRLTSSCPGSGASTLADSSPLRFRGCFTTLLNHSLATETYELATDAAPLTAPGWFDCFDATAIGADLESGAALPFVSEVNVANGVDLGPGPFAQCRTDEIAFGIRIGAIGRRSKGLYLLSIGAQHGGIDTIQRCATHGAQHPLHLALGHGPIHGLPLRPALAYRCPAK